MGWTLTGFLEASKETGMYLDKDPNLVTMGDVSSGISLARRWGGHDQYYIKTEAKEKWHT
jgi:hypothetical protein